MGRRAKYFTVADCASANQASVKKYTATSGGKAVRAVARRNRYLAETTRKESKHPPSHSAPLSGSVLGLPPLNIEIEQLFHLPLPEAHPFFREALTKPGALDESDLFRWKAEPPFVQDTDITDPYSATYHRWTESLVSVLHGVRLREQNERNVQRRAEFNINGRAAALVELRREVEELMSDWERVKALNIYHEYHQSREHSMYRHYVQWLACTIYHLYHLKFLD
ncbi:hypothetical protein FB451DRAFT_1194744 [Mycena latifolia]|nr:hypothetical protein FB451DRAFT_1194744 [Mycena latifolia]